MKQFATIGINKVIALLIAFAATLPFTGLAQVKYHAQGLSVTIAGTSTLHDWEMKANNGKCDAVFVLGPNDKITALSGLSFSMQATSLKSDSKMMDNNAYKALKTDAHSNIAFVLSSATVTQLDGNTYQLKCFGKLTIAGTTRETDLIATGKWNPGDKSFVVTGTKKIKMTDYNVKPPTVMMGTIKTGNDLSIAFNLRIVK